MLKMIIILSFLNATILFSFNKWGVFDWIHTYKPTWLKWYPECFFCYGFHLALLEVPFIAIFAPSWGLLIVPLCCTSLTWVIFKNMLHENR